MLHHPTVKTKPGATSIYVVVIATLLFSVITVSFIRIIINEANRTTSDELAQSAYDSDLAGVEDAKVALKKYYECQLSGDTEDEKCRAVTDNISKSLQNTPFTLDQDGNIRETTDVDCTSVALALGRPMETSGEVKIQESSDGSSDTVQAYTCVALNNSLIDYRSTLNSGSSLKVIPLKTAEGANAVKALKISWYSQENGTSYNFNETRGYNGGVYFSPLSNVSTPPTISAQLIQTSSQYTLEQLDSTTGNQTDRATVFLVPTEDASAGNTVGRDFLLDSNRHDRTDGKTPVKISCDSSGNSEFACSAILVLPEPVGGDRSDSTFFLIVSLPYGTPETNFAVNMCKDENCNTTTNFQDVQVSIDSTGRANDMYSRVEARVEFIDVGFPFPEFAIQATSTDGDAIKKNFYVTSDCYKLGEDENGVWGATACNNTGEVPDNSR